MKRKIFLTVAIVLGIVTILILLVSERAASAQRNPRYAADSGIITLGENQKLRVTVSAADEPAGVQIRKMRYGQNGCTSGPNALCNNEVIQGPIIFLQPNEGLFFDMFEEASDVAVRAVVTANKPTVQVNVLILDTTTGQTVSLMSTGEIDTW